MNIVTQVFVNLLILFGTAVLIVVGNALRKWLEEKANESIESGKNKVYGMLYDIVRIVVDSVEQMYLCDVDSAGSWTSCQKKKEAVKKISEWVTTQGYSGMISQELIDSCVEAVVKEMNDTDELSDEPTTF